MTAIDPPENRTESSQIVQGAVDFLNEKVEQKPEQESHSYDIPRPLLTMQQAAAFLGKSVRALERSLLGRWGNKLPEGWSAKKVKTESGDEWRILPPPGFRVRSSSTAHAETNSNFDITELTNVLKTDYLADSPAQKRSMFRAEHSIDQPTIVIDRSEEVEHLLRELLSTQKALSEERRLHMEDLRIVAQLQGSMRLLETNAAENSRARADLEVTKRELEVLKQEYNQVLNLPWWKRLFAFRRP